MKPGPIRQCLLVFLAALALYIASFTFIEHMRTRQGPWHVLFTTDTNGRPSITVSQAKLGLSGVRFVFEGETFPRPGLSRLVVFDAPRKVVPFGKVLFLDTTFQPGTVTFEIFGHEIELMRRTLVVNLKEIPWQSGAAIRLTQAEKIPEALRQPRKKLR